MSAKTKVTKTKTALKQETYNLSDRDLKHDLHCFFFESIFIDQATLNGTRPVTPVGAEPAMTPGGC